MAAISTVNYFLIINSFKQMKYVEYLVRKDFDSDEYQNVILYRRAIGTARKNIFIENNCSIKGIKIYSIPFIANAKNNKFFHHVNNTIYLLFFAGIFIKKIYRKSNVIFGNGYLVSNRIIANLFTKFIDNIFLLDEGTSTLDVFEKRNKFLRSNQRMKFNEFPRRSLKFVTSFNLKSNGFDEIIETNIFKGHEWDVKNSDVVIFIGTYLVEAHYISADELRKMIRLLTERNPGKDIIYIAHPRETEVFQILENEFKGIKIIKLSRSIEEYFMDMKNPPHSVCSTFSTAFYNSIDIFKGSVSYTVFQFAFDSVSFNKKQQLTTIYSQLREKLEKLNCRFVFVNS